MDELLTILEGLHNPDNDLRARSENVYWEGFTANPDETARTLLHILCSDVPITARFQAAIQLCPLHAGLGRAPISPETLKTLRSVVVAP
jgi:hypothetical protein